MQPYFPISLRQYHLGLYALTAVVQWLAQRPAHEALVLTAQTLSGLCGLGVYLTLSRLVGFRPALVGAVTVGLLSHLPAGYVNWGRFTQLASLTIMLAAWLMTWETLRLWTTTTSRPAVRLTSALLASILNAGVFLLHFRVAGFQVPWLALAVVWFLPRARAEHRVPQLGQAVIAVSMATFVLVLPALASAAPEYVGRSLATAAAPLTAERLASRQQFNNFPLTSWPYLVGRPWLLAVALLAAGLRLRRRDRLVTITVIWVLFLLAIGHANQLGLPLIGFTNLGAVLISLYLPISLVIGAGAAEPLVALKRVRLPTGRPLWAAGLAVCLLGIRDRAADIEPYRHFITPADVAAMDWIREHTPNDALFAVNTVFWLPRAPHGTDGGYWIPYFTGRATTAGAMLHGQGEPRYEERVVAMSRAVIRLAAGEDALDELRSLGVTHVYIGAKGNFAGPALDPRRLEVLPGVHRLYEHEGVTILTTQDNESSAGNAHSAQGPTDGLAWYHSDWRPPGYLMNGGLPSAAARSLAYGSLRLRLAFVLPGLPGL